MRSLGSVFELRLGVRLHREVVVDGFRESKGASEHSSSDPQWSGIGGGIGERGGLRVMWLLS